MKHKYKITRYFTYERKALESYINVMAEQGWHIDQIGYWWLRFYQSTKSAHYSVLLMDKQTEEDLYFETPHQKEYKSFMEEFGLTFVCSYGAWQIFESNKENLIYTDEVVEFQKVDELSKQDKKALLPYLGTSLFAWILVGLCAFFMSDFDFTMLFFDTIFLYLIICVLGVTLTSFIYRFQLRTYRKSQRLESNPKISRFRFMLPLFTTLLCIGIMFTGSFCYVLLLIGSLFYRSILKNEKTRKRNAIFYLVGMTCLFLLSITHYEIPWFHKEIPEDSMIQVLDYRYDHHTKSSGLFIEKEMYTNDEDYISLMHVTVKNSPLESIVINHLNGYYPENGFYVEEGTTMFKVNDHEYWQIPGQLNTMKQETLEKYVNQ